MRIKRNGFTLVELLVVIAILTILAGLLLPALGRAKESARRIVCLNNQKQIGIAAMAYADSYERALPPIGKNTPVECFFQLPHWAYYARNNNTSSTAYLGPGMHNLGCFVYDEIVTPDVLYCPSLRTGSKSRSRYPDPWMTSKDTVRTGLFFNVHKTNDNPQNARQQKYRRLDDVPLNTILGSDMAHSLSSMAHDEDPVGWNALFADGHVSFLHGQAAYEYMALSEAGGTNIGDDWTAYRNWRSKLLAENQ